ncbi:hypothetical protein AKJ16_DCAP05530, partial [Drosera capensis]
MLCYLSLEVEISSPEAGMLPQEERPGGLGHYYQSLSSAISNGHNSDHRIHTKSSRQNAPIANKQTLDLPSLAHLIHGRTPWINPHSAAAHLMSRSDRARQPVQ